MELLTITGMSGSGKSRAASILEDIGYYIVDNLPAEMMVKFADFCISSHGHYDRVALVYDVRAGEPFDLLVATLERLKRTNVDCRLLFLDADTAAIINRYKETRRAHPLSAEGRGIEQAVMLERQMLQPVRITRITWWIPPPSRWGSFAASCWICLAGSGIVRGFTWT